LFVGNVAGLESNVEFVPLPSRTGASVSRAMISFTSPAPDARAYGEPQA